MTARSFRELEAWKLASELRRQILPLLLAPSVSRHRKFCDQITDSSESVHRNIAEGFGRYNPAEFARFLGIARASLDETEDSLRTGAEHQYFEAQSRRPGPPRRCAADGPSMDSNRIC